MVLGREWRKMAGKKTELNVKQQSAILALMQTTTIGQAAKKAGIGRRTLDRWLTSPSFQNAYKLAQRQVFSQSMAKLQQLTGLAVNTLESILNSNTHNRTKVTAARIILENARAAIELDDLLQRLDKLEKILDGTQKS